MSIGCGCKRRSGHLVQSCKICDHVTSRRIKGSRGVIYHGDGPVWGCKKGHRRFLNVREDGSNRWVPRLCDDFVFTLEGQLSAWGSIARWFKRWFK